MVKKLPVTTTPASAGTKRKAMTQEPQVSVESAPVTTTPTNVPAATSNIDLPAAHLEGVKLGKKFKKLLAASTTASSTISISDNTFVQLSAVTTPTHAQTKAQNASTKQLQAQQRTDQLKQLQQSAAQSLKQQQQSTDASTTSSKKIKILPKQSIQNIEISSKAQTALQPKLTILSTTTTTSGKALDKKPAKKEAFDLSKQLQEKAYSFSISPQSQHNNTINTINPSISTCDDDDKSELQIQLEKKLQGAQFRVLNEQLYTTDSSAAFQMLQNEPELFEIYHQGFRTQVEKWPVNPLDVIIAKLKNLIQQHWDIQMKKITLNEEKSSKKDNVMGDNDNNLKKSSKPKVKPFAIADMGCGDAQLALSFSQHVNLMRYDNLMNTFLSSNAILHHNNYTTTAQAVDFDNKSHVYSFDLVAPQTKQLSLPILHNNTIVETMPIITKKGKNHDNVPTHTVITPCDVSHVPLPPGTVDCVVFCLSLMGTNFIDFLVEAHRILRVPSSQGVSIGQPSLIIAEVRSRFDEQQKESSAVSKKVSSKNGKEKDNSTTKNANAANVYKKFISFVEALGFKLLKYDKSNKMFVLFEFVKVDHTLIDGKYKKKFAGPKYSTSIQDDVSFEGVYHRIDSAQNNSFVLKPCIYKRR